ncbi:MAG: hypothetical protein D6693_01995 [Planctomycetota bacterium]|nr:MAG: hypothetical protein D6693_01995 [Planctomycetota bacterium]
MRQRDRRPVGSTPPAHGPPGSHPPASDAKMRRRTPTMGRFLLALALAVCVAPAASTAAPDDPALRAYHAANGFLSRGLNELAVREYRAFLEQHAGHDAAPVARYGLGVALHRLGRIDEAADALSPLVGVDFEFAADADLLLGQCRFAQGRYAEASARFESMLARAPDHASAPAAAALLVEARHRADDDAGAVAAARAFLERYAGDARADRVRFFEALSLVRRDRHAEAASVLGALLDEAPDSDLAGRAALLRAQCLQRTGAVAEAARLFARVADSRDGALTPDALYGLATAREAAGDADAAEAFERFLRVAPDHARAADAGVRLARLLIEAGRVDRARAVLREAAPRPGADATAVGYWLAKCDLREDRPADAARRLADLAEPTPDHALAPLILYDLAVARSRAGDDAGAGEALDRFLERFAGHDLAPAALALRASTASRLGEHARAARLCRRFLAGSPDGASAEPVRFLLAESLLLAGDDAAEEAYADYLARHADAPGAALARLRLGTIRYWRGDYDAAEPLLADAGRSARRDDRFTPALLMLGEIAYARGDWAGAEDLMTRYLSRADGGAPSRDAALLKIGLARVRRGDHAGAVEALTRLVDEFARSPLVALARFERGQSLVALGRPGDAEPDFVAVLESSDDEQLTAPAHNHLGAIAAAAGDHESAVAHFRAAAASTDGALAADAMARLGRSLAALGRHEESAEVFARLAREHPDAAPAREADARRALALARAGRDDEALALLSRLDDAAYARLPAPLAAALRYELAWILRDHGDTDAALGAYHALLAGAPDDSLRAHALVESADLLIDGGSFADAADALREAVGLIDARAEAAFRAGALYRLGLALYRMGEHADAAAALTEALGAGALDSTLVPAARLMAGESLFQQGRFGLAADHFAAVIEAGGDDERVSTALLRLGECRSQQRRWSDAERAFTDFLSRFSESPVWFQARFGEGWARENLSRHEDAIAAYRDVTERHDGPTAARAQFQIGECLFALGRHEEAAAELLKVDVLYAYPEWSAAALYEAGRCFEALNQPAQARDQYRRVVAEHADTAWAAQARARLEALSNPDLPGR